MRANQIYHQLFQSGRNKDINLILCTNYGISLSGKTINNALNVSMIHMYSDDKYVIIC